MVTSVGPSLHALSVKDVIKVPDRGEKRVPGQGVGGWGVMVLAQNLPVHVY